MNQHRPDAKAKTTQRRFVICCGPPKVSRSKASGKFISQFALSLDYKGMNEAMLAVASVAGIVRLYFIMDLRFQEFNPIFEALSCFIL
jgi:hypothetical protein